MEGRILLLQTDKSSLWSYKGRTLNFNQANFNDEEDTVYYDLYLLNDSTIKEGDWFIGEILQYQNNCIVVAPNGDVIFCSKINIELV